MIKRMMVLLLALCALLMCAAALAQEEALEALPQKVVYLTFDDGPKKDTPELLALLEELDVPATFFFMGMSVKAYPEHAKMVVDAGYPVGCHSMGHTPSYLVENPGIMATEIKRFMKLMREVAGESFDTDIFRFPGGSSSYPQRVKRDVVNAGFAWFDWNAMTADTHAGMKTQDFYDYAVKTSGKQEVIILLMHEGKSRTRDILPQLVDYYRENGYVFRVLSTDAGEREILARCGAAMMLPETEEAQAQEGEKQ